MSAQLGRKARRLLETLEQGDRHDRAEAAVKLGRRGVEEARPALEAMLDDPDDLLAVTAVFALWSLGGAEVPVDRAAASLSSADEETVQAAAHALCEMGEDAVAGLLALLETDSPHSRQVLRILGDIGGERAIAALERVSRSSDPELAATALEALED